MSGFKTFVIVFLAVICALIVWNCVSNYQEYQSRIASIGEFRPRSVRRTTVSLCGWNSWC